MDESKCNCLACGYNLRGVTVRCPECGRPFDRHDPESYSRGSTSTLRQRLAAPPGELLRTAGLLCAVAVLLAGLLDPVGGFTYPLGSVAGFAAMLMAVWGLRLGLALEASAGVLHRPPGWGRAWLRIPLFLLVAFVLSLSGLLRYPVFLLAYPQLSELVRQAESGERLGAPPFVGVSPVSSVDRFAGWVRVKCLDGGFAYVNEGERLPWHRYGANFRHIGGRWYVWRREGAGDGWEALGDWFRGPRLR